MKEIVECLHNIAKEATKDIMYEAKMWKPSNGITVIIKNL